MLPITEDLPVFTTITQAVLNESGWTSAWDQIEAIQEFLSKNNTPPSSEIAGSNVNRGGSGISSILEDTSVWILEEALEGDCDEFATVFAAMLSIGLPTRRGYRLLWWNMGR